MMIIQCHDHGKSCMHVNKHYQRGTFEKRLMDVHETLLNEAFYDENDVFITFMLKYWPLLEWAHETNLI